MRPSSARVKRRALPNEEECEREHLDRRVTGASHQLMRKCHEGAGRNFLGELWEGILHMYNTAIMKLGSTLFYRRYVIEALTLKASAIALMPDKSGVTGFILMSPSRSLPFETIISRPW